MSADSVKHVLYRFCIIGGCGCVRERWGATYNPKRCVGVIMAGESPRIQLVSADGGLQVKDDT